MREEQVANGVNFLVHPKAKAAPLSQRIVFLENKGLTAEEISAALSRAEGGSDGSNESTPAAGGAPTASVTLSSTPAPFPAEASVPLWRQAAVPGALVLGAVGALGAYYTSSQSAPSRGQSQGGASSPLTAAGAASGETAGFAGAGLPEPAGVDSIRAHAAYTEGAYAQDGSGPLRRVEDGAGPFILGGVNGLDGGFPRDGEGAAGGAAGESPSSPLAGEFRRMTDKMEQQTGHLVEAVMAMKALASRAEQDSSSLLAARVSSHTSELRAELETIKQLLLLQAGGEGAASALTGGAPSNKIGAGGGVGSVASDGKPAVRGAKDSGAGNGVVGSRDEEGVRGVEDRQMSGASVKSGLPTRDLEEEKAKEAADKAAAEAAALAATERRKETARAALSALLANNAPRAAKDGIAMLRMLVANLVNQPNVPRYRRIASSNDNFKKRLLPLEGYRAMMEAVGFRAKGSLWEWTWHEDSGPSASNNNKAVLEDVVKAIDAVARPNGPPMSSASPVGSSSAAAPPPTPATIAVVPNAAVATEKGKLPGDGDKKAVAATVHETNGGARYPRFPDASVAAGVVAAATAGVATASAGGATKGIDGEASSAGAEVVQPRRGGGEAVKTLAAREGMIAAAAGVDGIGKGAGDRSRSSDGAGDSPAGVSSGESVVAAGPQGTGAGAGAGVETVTAEQEAPPASMAEVAAAIQRGDEPPGIRVVEDRLSADARSLEVSSQPSPPKPWEVVAGKGATHDGVGEGTGDGVRAANGGGGREFAPAGEGRSRPQHAVAVGP